MIRLGVNIDHVATLRNARNEKYPDPLHAAKEAEAAGADNITCHLREDRRHIKDRDVYRLQESISVPLNLEIAATSEMIKIALDVNPHAVTLVPEKRQEQTTESGLELKSLSEDLKGYVEQLKGRGILVSLFVEADQQSIELTHRCGADAIEIHTGDFCNRFNKASTTSDRLALMQPFIAAGELGRKLGLQVHVGHGLNYSNAHFMQTVPFCEEANIGHAIVGQAMFVGFRQAVADMKNLLNNKGLRPDILTNSFKRAEG
jgi:pyridoxine 5-phosphate synthase